VVSLVKAVFKSARTTGTDMKVYLIHADRSEPWLESAAFSSLEKALNHGRRTLESELEESKYWNEQCGVDPEIMYREGFLREGPIPDDEDEPDLIIVEVEIDDQPVHGLPWQHMIVGWGRGNRVFRVSLGEALYLTRAG
jgi:hypothetical protein